jgi:hypothetical protein
MNIRMHISLSPQHLFVLLDKFRSLIRFGDVVELDVGLAEMVFLIRPEERSFIRIRFVEWASVTRLDPPRLMNVSNSS